jgi:hypothetical protein
MSDLDVKVEELCVLFHNAYEAAAVQEGWETQERSRKPWADVPPANKATMRATVREVLRSGWLARQCAEALREAADEISDGSGNHYSIWDGQQVEYRIYECSPNDETPKTWLRQRADSIEKGTP